jgi:rod shape-determining protein MreC
MPIGSLDRPPPHFFRQGTSALSKLFVFSALALFIMVADARFKITQSMRVVIASVLYPVQWMVMRPVLWTQNSARYFESLTTAQDAADAARDKLRLQSQRANEAEQLALENERLRKLLDLRERVNSPGLAAQVLYDAADPYTRKVVIDKGMLQGVVAGSPVLDELGVLGQVTRVYPSVSEVTLVIDADQAIPVLNTRTGARAVAFGDPGVLAGALEVRFMASNADVQAGDLLTTSGVDGVYPPGLPVAVVDKVERRIESPFARIFCTPKALVEGAMQVLVLQPVGTQIPARPAPDAAPAAAKKGRQK